MDKHLSQARISHFVIAGVLTALLCGCPFDGMTPEEVRTAIDRCEKMHLEPVAIEYFDQPGVVAKVGCHVPRKACP